MSTRVSLTSTGGEVIAVKAATTPEQQAALAAEALRLRQAEHPGVVAIVDHRQGDGHAELRTRFAGEPLGCWRGTPGAAASLVAAVACTIADLHDRGLVHGRIDPSHVLLDGDGRPRLCGWAPPGDEATPTDDVAALGRLLESLAERASAPAGATRGVWYLWPRAQAADRHALHQVAAQATDPVAGRRPTARSLARSLVSAVPGAGLPSAGAWPRAGVEAEPSPAIGAAEPSPTARAAGPGPLDGLADQVFGDQSAAEPEELFIDRRWDAPPPTDASPTPRHRGRARLAAAAALGFVVVAAGGYAVRAGAPSDVGAQEPTVPPAPAAARPCAPANPTSREVQRRDIDGDGCPDAVAVDRGVIEAAGQRWAIGEPGDAVAVGDWDCDGVATPAVYRPASGDVFVFTGWAAAGQPLATQAIAQVAGGRGLARSPAAGPAGTGSGGCDMLSIELAGGGQRVVEVPR